MAFSDFNLRSAVEAFGLEEDRDSDLFSQVAPLEISEFTRELLDEFTPVVVSVNSELARSVYLIAPLLTEAKRRAKGPANIFPGFTLDVDRERGLNGYCDYVISRSPEFYYLRGPLVAVFEAKREDIIGGLGQCAAAMVALRLFNDREKTPVPAVYGCVSSGTNWRFLKLQGTRLSIDRPEYYLSEPGKIVGILVSILNDREGV